MIEKRKRRKKKKKEEKRGKKRKKEKDHSSISNRRSLMRRGLSQNLDIYIYKEEDRMRFFIID